MEAEQKKTVEMIRQVRENIETRKLSPEQIPVSDLENLIRVTIGKEFTGKEVAVKKEKLHPLVATYLRLLQHCIELKDVEGCVRTLELLEKQYECFDMIWQAYKAPKYIEKYKKTVSAVGMAYSELQYSMLSQKQQGKCQKTDVWENGRGVVYTCILQNKMKPQQPEYINVNWDYVCFTDMENKWGSKEGVWEYRRIPIENQENKNDLFRTCMLKPDLLLSEYDFSIWVNPKYKIVGELELFLKSFGENASFLAFPSYLKSDIYDTMYTTLFDDDKNIAVRKKYLQYQKEGYPQHNGVISNSVMVRKHGDEKLRAVMETWWQEAVQCERMWEYGFTYAAWKHDFEFAICNLFVELNSYFKNMELDLEVRKNA